MQNPTVKPMYNFLCRRLGQKMTVYLDELIIVNFVLDYLLLWGAGLISAQRLRRWRIALGAALGSAYALICALCEWGIVFWLPVKLGVGFAMCFLSYGKRTWRTVGWFFALSTAMAGGVYVLSAFSGGRIAFLSGAVYFRLSGMVLLLIAGAVWLGLTALARLPVLGRGRTADRINASITCLGRTAEAEVFIDTGCLLRDPTDNSPVLVVSRELGYELLPDGVVEAFQWGKTAEEAVLLGGDHAPRLIFATGIGSSQALYAFSVFVSFGGGEYEKMTAAVSPTLGREGIRALMGQAS